MTGSVTTRAYGHYPPVMKTARRCRAVFNKRLSVQQDFPSGHFAVDANGHALSETNGRYDAISPARDPDKCSAPVAAASVTDSSPPASRHQVPGPGPRL